MDKFFEGRHFGTDPKSGLTFPEVEKIAYAYGLPYYKLENSNDLDGKLKEILNLEGFALVEVICPFEQIILPSSSTKQNEDGKLISQPLENMFPFLSKEEFKTEMIIKPL